MEYIGKSYGKINSEFTELQRCKKSVDGFKQKLNEIENSGKEIFRWDLLHYIFKNDSSLIPMHSFELLENHRSRFINDSLKELKKERDLNGLKTHSSDFRLLKKQLLEREIEVIEEWKTKETSISNNIVIDKYCNSIHQKIKHLLKY